MWNPSKGEGCYAKIPGPDRDTMKVFVQIVSAPWCKRCVEIKPRVAELCRLAGAHLEEVNYDELEEDSAIKLSVTALPTIRTLLEREGGGGIWASYTPKELGAWEDAMKSYALTTAGEQDLDF